MTTVLRENIPYRRVLRESKKILCLKNELRWKLTQMISNSEMRKLQGESEFTMKGLESQGNFFFKKTQKPKSIFNGTKCKRNSL